VIIYATHTLTILELCYLPAGKYLNNYGLKASGVGLDHIPPGWTTWFTLQGNRWENPLLKML